MLVILLLSPAARYGFTQLGGETPASQLNEDVGGTRARRPSTSFKQLVEDNTR